MEKNISHLPFQEPSSMGHRAPSYQSASILSGHGKSFGAESPRLNHSSPGYSDQSAWLDNYYHWLEYNPIILNEMRQQRHPIDGWNYGSSYEPYHRPHWFPQEPVLMVPQGYVPDFYKSIQDFQYFVVIDFEATCDKPKKPYPQEIIEFPSVLVNSTTWEIEDWFQTYVRPSHNRDLSTFCKALTGIQQYQVDGGVLLSDALLLHDKWLQDRGVKNTNFAIVTWSNWDCNTMLESECEFKKIEKPTYFNHWINLKIPFAAAYGGSKCNLEGAVERAGLTWEGRPHCGLDDAKNTANLLINLMACGLKLSITNTLTARPKTKPSHLAKPYKYLGTTPFAVSPPPARVVNPPEADDAIVPRVYCHCGAVGGNLAFYKNKPNKGGFYFECGYCTPEGPSLPVLPMDCSEDWV